MPFNPQDVIYPMSRIKRVVRVLHDGVLNSPHEFSIAELEFHDNSTAFGIRHNLNEWNEENPDLGYPTCRPGNPTWFILPDVDDLLPVLNQLFSI